MSARIERKTRETIAKSDHFAAILPLEEPYIPDTVDLVERIERIVSASGARVLLHPEMRKIEAAEQGGGGLLSFGRPTRTRMVFLVIDHVGIWIAARAGEYEFRSGLTRWVNTDLWPGGPAEVARHRAWVEIADLGFMRDRGVARLDRAFNRAAAVTAATAAVAEACNPLAVLWYPAKNTLPVNAFSDQVGQVVNGRAPLALWMRYLYIRSDDPELNEGVVTKGLAPFCDHEIEVLPSTLSPSDARAMAFEFARLVIDRGTEPRSGMLLTPGRSHTATVRVGESELHRGLRVYELTVSARGTASASRA
ncbi:MAG: hypothetical protein AAFV86_02750 [Pseudomonadota bacterium]